ncbi:hypothetical protein BaRGS_00012516 [Batillaria attramentaria]|uniref:Uncharacterized protein n=1 Tax=Batillaria attramentaria TaxID=370345 RepID=A0ABD0LAQ0_9CAEN
MAVTRLFGVTAAQHAAHQGNDLAPAYLRIHVSPSQSVCPAEWRLFPVHELHVTKQRRKLKPRDNDYLSPRLERNQDTPRTSALYFLLHSANFAATDPYVRSQVTQALDVAINKNKSSRVTVRASTQAVV